MLSACGVDVDRALPWIRPWFVRYQMADGGLNCDSDAYLRTDECPSSMVGTVPPFEAMLRRRDWTPDERVFVERAASFLIDRKLTRGSRSAHNAEERDAAAGVARAVLPALLLLRRAARPRRAGALGRARRGFAPARRGQRRRSSTCSRRSRTEWSARDAAPTPARRRWSQRDGAWVREPASTFPLLDVAGVLGEPSEALTRQWSETRRALLGLIDDGRLAHVAFSWRKEAT